MHPTGNTLRSPILVADIGATTSRFAVVGPQGRPERVLLFSNDSLSCAESAIQHYLDRAGVTPAGAVLAIAGPIDGDAIALTNRQWRFKLSGLRAQFGFSFVWALNDFEAVAWSLARLRAGDIMALQPADRSGGLSGEGTRVVFGPGTGLGVAALVPSRDGWTAVASEGGHVAFGPASADEEPVFARLRAAHGPISAETILSGPGIERLYRALNPDYEPLAAELIVGRAHRGDRIASETVSLFVRLLGRFAGDLALMFKATGGVYVAGGVAQRLHHLIDVNVFRAAFEQHPPYQELLAGIPTALVTLDEPGPLGCAVLAERVALQPPDSG
jgi:glucokinase